jgi:hypothetical protein
MSNDPKSHDWARNSGRTILGADPDRRRNNENGGDRRSRAPMQADANTPSDPAALRDAMLRTQAARKG